MVWTIHRYAALICVIGSALSTAGSASAQEIQRDYDPAGPFTPGVWYAQEGTGRAVTFTEPPPAGEPMLLFQAVFEQFEPSFTMELGGFLVEELAEYTRHCATPSHLLQRHAEVGDWFEGTFAGNLRFPMRPITYWIAACGREEQMNLMAIRSVGGEVDFMRMTPGFTSFSVLDQYSIQRELDQVLAAEPVGCREESFILGSLSMAFTPTEFGGEGYPDFLEEWEVAACGAIHRVQVQSRTVKEGEGLNAAFIVTLL